MFVLVQIYLDGTIGVSIGGTEMGQGLNIKCLQVASQALNLPIEKITMIEANTGIFRSKRMGFLGPERRGI